MSQVRPADGPESPENGGEMGAESGAPSADQDAGSRPRADAAAPEAERALRQRAQLAEDRLAEVLAAYRALKSENESHRERVTRNIERRYEQRRERLLLRFIEILDNLDRALEAAETSFASAALVEGLILVRTQLLNTLKEEGLERVPAMGLPYDPRHSEAVETRAVDEPEQHHVVVKELLRGYTLNGRVARASRVVVGHYGAGDAGGRGGAAREPEPTLEEIIARAEAQDRDPQPASVVAAAADADDDLADELGDDLAGYLGEDEPR